MYYAFLFHHSFNQFFKYTDQIFNFNFRCDFRALDAIRHSSSPLRCGTSPPSPLHPPPPQSSSLAIFSSARRAKLSANYQLEWAKKEINVYKFELLPFLQQNYQENEGHHLLFTSGKGAPSLKKRRIEKEVEDH